MDFVYSFYTVLVMSSLLDFLLFLESVFSSWLLFTSAVDFFGSGGDKGEFMRGTRWSFLDSSEDVSRLDKIFLSWVCWQAILPLFHSGKLNDDEMLSCRNEYAAFAMGKYRESELSSILPRLNKIVYHCQMIFKYHKIYQVSCKPLKQIMRSLFKIIAWKQNHPFYIPCEAATSLVCLYP